MADLLVHDVPDDVMAAIDVRARRLGPVPRRVRAACARARGIRVNFIYQPKDHTARPISAWRL